MNREDMERKYLLINKLSKEGCEQIKKDIELIRKVREHEYEGSLNTFVKNTTALMKGDHENGN